MAGLNFSGRASRALNQGVVDYTTALEASRAANEGLDSMDRRQVDAQQLQIEAGLRKRALMPTSSVMPTPIAVAGQRGNYDVGTVHSPAGVTPPGGFPALPPDGSSGVDTTPLPAKAPVAAVDTDVENLTKEQWDSMSLAEQKVMLNKVNRQIEVANSRNAVGSLLANGGITYPLGDLGITASKRLANAGIAGFNAIGADKFFGMDAPATPFTGGEYPMREWLRSMGGKGGKPLTADELRKGLANKPVSPAAREPQHVAARSVDTSKLSPERKALLTKLPEVAQTPRGKLLIDLSRAVGLNPAAALASYGMESSYGAVKTMSWAEAQKGNSAYGYMQVRPTTLRGDGGKERGVIAHFSDPQVLAKYGDKANNINAIVHMASGDPDSDEAQGAAGVLRLLYAKDIGVADNLLGAAYQAPAEAVLKAGGPTGASDKNMSNSDYSSNWNTLFSQASTVLGGGASTASSPAPQPAAPAGVTVASTGNKGFDSRVKFAMQKAPAEYDFQTQQLMQTRERTAQWLQQEEQSLQQEQQRLDSAYSAASQRFAAHKSRGDVIGMTAAMDELSATQKLNDDLQSRISNFNLTGQSTIDKFNNELIVNEADRAVRDLANGDPTRASSLISQAGGSQIVFQRSTTGGFVKIGPDGMYVVDEKGNAVQFTAAEVAKQVYDIADKAKAAAIDAGTASADSKRFESGLKIEEEKAKIVGELYKIRLTGDMDIERQMKLQDGDIAAVQDTPDGGKQIFYKGPEGRVVTVNPTGMTEMINGEEVEAAHIKVEYSGVRRNG